jgi:DNA mismatch endonuclease, patch repair protein
VNRMSPSYADFVPASSRSSDALRGSRKSGTTCETLLAEACLQVGLSFERNVRTLAGAPDLVFPDARIVVFCDGDFWHGRDWQTRRAKLSTGSNPAYWVSKISYNIRRDAEINGRLTSQGWFVMRFWEGYIRSAADQCARAIDAAVRHHGRAHSVADTAP